MLKQYQIHVGVVGAALMVMTALGNAESLDIGKREYDYNCAVCHGTTGKGDGPAAINLSVQPADLTSLAKRNYGLFPVDHAYDVIDGAKEAKPREAREMPIWGKEFREEALQEMLWAETADSIVHARIAALIGYIYSLQDE